MLSTLFEVGRAEVPCAQLGQGCFAGMCEFLEQSVERFSFTLVAVTEAFEGRKRLGPHHSAPDQESALLRASTRNTRALR